MKKVLHITTMANKFLLLSIVAVLVPLFSFLLFATSSYSRAIDNKLDQLTGNMLLLVNKNIQYIINDITDTGNLIVTSQAVQTVLSASTEQQEYNLPSYRTELECKDLLMNITNNKKYIGMVYLGNDFYSVSKEKTFAPAFNPLSISSEHTDGWLKKVMDARGKGIWISTSEATEFQDSLMVYSRMVKNLNSIKPIGILVIGINKYVFHDIFSDVNNINNTQFIITQGDDILYNSISADSSSSIPFSADEMNTLLSGEGLVTLDIGKRFYVKSMNIANAGWTVTSITPYELFAIEKTQTFIVFSAIALITFAVAIFCSYCFTKNITKALKHLSNYVDNLKRGIKGKLEFKTSDEIGIIGNEFMKVVEENEVLNTNLYKTKYKEKEAELLLLQLQINPHFLYNALDSIFWIAEEHGATEISKLVVALSKVFKLSLNNGERLITFRRELEMVESYIHVQKMRYEDKFNVKMNIDENLMNHYIMKFILQPLVENAITHGIAPKEGDGTIIINASIEQNDVLISVKDDGIGFAEPQEEILKHGYALRNINDRIQLYYGSEYGLHLKSIPGKGSLTCVKIKLES